MAGLFRWLLGKALRLPPRLTGTVAVESGLRCPMRDGVELVADRYFDPARPRAPVVLIRTPYGRSAMFGVMAGLMAERGLQVVVQSVRGVSGSGGVFDPMRQERSDGADTVDWLRAQPWFAGQLFTFGMSYLGNAQWAMAMDRAEAITGMGLGVTLSDFSDELRGFGGFTLGGMLAWTQTMRLVSAEGGRGARRHQPSLEPHFAHLPLGTIDQAAFGEEVPHWQAWMAHDDPQDPFWRAMDYSAGVTNAKAPALMVAGWRDIFLPFQLRDFTARQAAGLDSWITIGPWTHAAPGGMIAGLKDAIIGFPAIAAGRPPVQGRDRVRLYVEGAKQWRDYPAWPPPGSEERRLYLAADGKLVPELPAEPGAQGYTYDPADPTPAVHGPALFGGKKIRDMAALEDRTDSVSFTAAPFDRACEAIGPVSVELAVRSDREYTDFYACLCDVDSRGRAVQVCDGYLRLSPGQPEAAADGTRRITIECWPAAWRFDPGHAMRLIVASGAHPRYARNLGTGESLASATRMVPARQEVRFGADAASALVFREVPIG
jgi:uncharacterized protein